jgi:hypothetical protein
MWDFWNNGRLMSLILFATRKRLILSRMNREMGGMSKCSGMRKRNDRELLRCGNARQKDWGLTWGTRWRMKQQVNIKILFPLSSEMFVLQRGI